LPSPPPPPLFPYTTLFRSSAGGCRNIGAIVDQQTCGSASRDFDGALRQLEQHARGKSFFSDLDEIYSRPNGGGNLRQHFCKLARDRKSTRLNSSHRTISYA